MFAHGVVGYVDDRRADGVGWGRSTSARCGRRRSCCTVASDSIVDVAQAAHTASLVPGARLEVVDGLAHLSIVMRIPETLAEL